MRRWLRPSRRLPRDLMPVPPRSRRLSQKSAASIPEATSFSTSVDAMRREVLSAADLICWGLRTAAVRTRAGNANTVFPEPLEPKPTASSRDRAKIDLHASIHSFGGRQRGAQVPAFALVGLPKMLLPVALRHQHVD